MLISCSPYQWVDNWNEFILGFTAGCVGIQSHTENTNDGSLKSNVTQL